MRWDAAVARRYARAFLEALPPERRQAEDDALAQAARELMEPPLGPVLRHPGIPARAKRQLLDAAYDGSPWVKNLLAVLVDHGRERLLPLVAEQYHVVLLEASGRVAATVRTARPLDDGRRERLVRRLSEVLGREVDAAFEVDPALLGGVEVRFGDHLWDGTVKGRLMRLRRALRDEVRIGEA